MSEVIPEKYLDLFEKQAFGNLGTLMKDGSPQVTPVWVDYDGKHVRFNSAKGRVKDKNVRRDPRESLSLFGNPRPRRGNHRKKRGRSHQQTLAEISRQARISLSPAWRGPRHLQDRTAKSQLHGIVARNCVLGGPPETLEPRGNARGDAAAGRAKDQDKAVRERHSLAWNGQLISPLEALGQVGRKTCIVRNDGFDGKNFFGYVSNRAQIHAVLPIE